MRDLFAWQALHNCAIALMHLIIEWLMHPPFQLLWALLIAAETKTSFVMSPQMATGQRPSSGCSRLPVRPHWRWASLMSP